MIPFGTRMSGERMRSRRRACRMLIIITVSLLVGGGRGAQRQFLFAQGALPLRANFNGADRDFGSMPPDLSIAAGPASVVMATNDGVTIRDKTGALVSRTELNAFFNPVRPNDRERLIDVSIYYDPIHGRFFVAAC